MVAILQEDWAEEVSLDNRIRPLVVSGVCGCVGGVCVVGVGASVRERERVMEVGVSGGVGID